MMRSLTGPAIVITIGLLFLLHQVHGGHFYFGNTWPILLLVIGLLQLGSALASREGHIEPVPPTAPPPAVPPADPQQTPYGTQGH
jgi:LiaI-LiaF-like transmembrane region